ncbi:phosphoglycerate mutase-like protein [Polychaeton citri CBS 116435]|uniref:Phosphoglycerate mutase-like protein n=1 Tax=Polychaeton citri CBS 116435 TaxID=1314669 RepID=A0A9P4QAD1_9PEZI|nr:phosphoglycerate mutase-like protein [Polychaeton citri CBS 116435]
MLTILLPLLASSVYAQPQTPLYSSYKFNPLEHLAGIAPYFKPQDPPKDPSPPQGCSVTRAAYLVRHAAINANDFDYEEYIEPFLAKLSNSTAKWSQIPGLNFLATWQEPDTGEQERLTRTGKLEAAQLGVTMSYRYDSLRLPKRVWSSSAERTVASAKGLIRGIETEDDQINLVQIYESKESGADSLTPYHACPAYSSSYGSDQSSTYVKKYTAPIIARFKDMAPAFNWTANDIVAMQELCGYDTVIRGSSPFCSLDLFSPDEWLQFEYSNDIQYFYNAGYGNSVSGAIGYPWLNETLDLLSTPPVDDDQDLYISFTHREMPPTVLVALGLFNNSEFGGSNDINATMPLDQINYGRRWVSSYILPFLANIAIERMNCSESYGYKNQTDSTYYRVLVNQSPQTIPGCFDGPSESCSAAGMKQFVKERGQLFGGFSEKCSVAYQNSTDLVSFYSSADNGTVVGK